MSDTHAGSALGLCNPDVELDVENGCGKSPNLAEGQLYLWNDVYLTAIDSIKSLAGKDKIVLLHLGDVTQGSKFPQEMMGGDSLANQISIGESIFDPWLHLKSLSAIRIAKGTGVHSYEGGSSEVIVGHLLEQNVDTRVAYHGLLDVGGCKIDYAHHGPSVGNYQWTKGNVARGYLRNTMLSALVAGEIPPQIVLRGHYHSFLKEFLYMRGHESWIVVMPSMCLLSEYVIKVTHSGFEACNGMIALEIIDGKLHQIHSFIKSLSLRMEETFGN